MKLKAESVVTGRESTFILMLKLMRPQQWSKNLLLFAALLFTIPNITPLMIFQASMGFLLFSAVSSCVYILNDYSDMETDRKHPEKKYRPLASGELSPRFALATGTVILLFSLFVSFAFDGVFGALLTAYFGMNVAYSFYLKHVVIIDVMTIAAGFVMRAVGGALIIDVPFTPWFLLCTMLLALFLAISKRRHEVLLYRSGKADHRPVLQMYSSELLDQLNSIVTSATITAYALFTLTSNHTKHLIWTLPIVLYGIFRYLYLIHQEDKGEQPDEVMLEDKHMLGTVILFGCSVIVILTWFE